MIKDYCRELEKIHMTLIISLNEITEKLDTVLESLKELKEKKDDTSRTETDIS